MTTTAASPVLRTDFQRSIADYWNDEQDPVNVKLGEVDGLCHHHYGLGAYDESVLSGPEETRDARVIAELHRLESARAEVLLDHLGPTRPEDRLLDGGSGRGGTSLMANRRFGCRVDGVTSSQKQVDFANAQAARWGVADKVAFHFRNMLETGDFGTVWTNETTMYVDLFELFGEFSRLLRHGGR